MLTEGKKAPTFSLESSDGGRVSLAALAGKTVVLYFYPKDNTPGCTVEAQEFRDAMPTLKKLGVVVLGVSKDSIASHCKFRDKYQLNFPLLTDSDEKMMTAYDAWGEKSMYGKKFMGIIRSTVIIDGAGKVVKHFAKVSVKGHVDEVLAALAAMNGGKPAATVTAPPKPAAKPTAKPAAKATTKPTKSAVPKSRKAVATSAKK